MKGLDKWLELQSSVNWSSMKYAQVNTHHIQEFEAFHFDNPREQTFSSCLAFWDFKFSYNMIVGIKQNSFLDKLDFPLLIWWGTLILVVRPYCKFILGNLHERFQGSKYPIKLWESETPRSMLDSTLIIFRESTLSTSTEKPNVRCYVHVNIVLLHI